MYENFSSFYRPTEDKIQSVWKNATFVFDANVLLNIYRYPESVVKELIDTVEIFKDRVWLPHNVALEFQRNRLNVIAAQRSRIEDVRKLINTGVEELNAKIKNLDLAKRHSFIEPEILQKIFSDAKDRANAKIDDFSAKQIDVFHDDPIRARIDEIFINKIGPPPTDSEQLSSIYDDAKDRFERKQPPGYADKNKAASELSQHIHMGLQYRTEYGDFLNWQQILEFAKSPEVNGIVFVTDDAKEDWWWKINSIGPKTVGPRRELLEEFQINTGNDNFLMYSSESFLKYARKESGASVSSSSIRVVEDFAQRIRGFNDRINFVTSNLRQNMAKFSYLAETAIIDFLHVRYPKSKITERAAYPDLFLEDRSSGDIIAVEVKAIAANTSYSYIQSAAMKLSDFSIEAGFSKYYLFLVSDGKFDSPDAVEFFLEELDLAKQVTVFMGYIDSDGEFVETRQFS